MPRFASHDGTLLSYRALGQGPPLVCLPGGPGRSAKYLGDLGRLLRYRTLMLLDPRGVGQSDAPEDTATYAVHRLDADVLAFCDHLGLSRVDLLGHSAGANVAQVFVGRHPDRLARLVLVTPGGRLQGVQPADVEGIRRRRRDEEWYPDAAAAVQQEEPESPDDWWALMMRTQPFYYGRWTEAAQLHAAVNRAEVSAAAAQGYAAGWGDETFDKAATVQALGKVTGPVLVVAGAKDGAAGMFAPRAVAACFPAARMLVLQDSGHYPWVDQPGEFARAVDGFLRAAAVPQRGSAAQTPG